MLGTTVANVIGCAAIGGLIEYAAVDGAMGERMRLAIQVGFLGGLTTFSTFAAESSSLVFDGRLAWAGVYMAANFLLGWVVLIAAAGWVKGWAG